MKPSSVDTLVAGRLGLPEHFSREELENAQLQLLKKTLSHAVTNNSFYRESLSALPSADGFSVLKSLQDIKHLPFTGPDDIKDNSHKLLCVSQSRVARVVTMQTSGSTGEPKRLSFTQKDLSATTEFFREGMYNLVDDDDSVLVLLPFEQPASVGELLIKALEAAGISAKGLWPPKIDHALNDILDENGTTCIVGLPQHLLAVSSIVAGRQIRSMLLCSDYAPQPLRQQIERNCGCETFLHYGSTESGLGGAVECSIHDGCHIRESDLLVEIIDPVSNTPLSDGETGEVVLTTLGKEAMVLLRYRTGDLASLDRTPCRCGGITARLKSIRGRSKGCSLPAGMLHSQDVDDQIFTIPGILDYRATLEPGPPDILKIEFTTHRLQDSGTHIPIEKIAGSLHHIPVVKKSVKDNLLNIRITRQDNPFQPDHTAKHTILDLREEGINETYHQPFTQRAQ